MCDYRGAQTIRVSIMESKSFPGGVAFCTAVSSHPYDTVRERLFCFSHLHHQVTFYPKSCCFLSTTNSIKNISYSAESIKNISYSADSIKNISYSADCP